MRHDCAKTEATYLALKDLLDVKTRELEKATAEAEGNYKAAKYAQGRVDELLRTNEMLESKIEGLEADVTVFRHKYEDMNREANIWHDKRKESELQVESFKKRLHQAVHSRCSCGGMGPGACGCDYCALYHFVLGNTVSEAHGCSDSSSCPECAKNRDGGYIMHQMACPFLRGELRCTCQPIKVTEKRKGDTYPNCKEPGCCGNPRG